MPFPVPLSALRQPARLVGVILLVAPLLAWADDSYLREIEEEAKRQAATLITSQPRVEPTPTTTTLDIATERLAPGLDRAAFERNLREKQPETHAFYQKLNSAGQQQIYEAYRNDNRLVAIGARIAQLLSGKP